LATIEELGGHEELKVFVIGSYPDRMLRSFKIVTPMLHGFDNGEHFAVVSVVVAFGGSTFARPEGHRVQTTVMRLGDETGHGEAGGVSVERGFEIWIEMAENGSGGEQGLQCIEGGLRGGVPFESLALAKKGGDRHNDARVSFDEPAVEVSEAKKYLDVKEGVRGRPIGNGGNAFRVH